MNEPLLTIINYIFVLGIGQALLLCVFLFNKQENKAANKYLIFANIIFALDMFSVIIYISGLHVKLPFLIGYNLAFPYVYGPAIYLYSLSIRRNDESIRKKNLLHFLPFVLIIIYHSIVLQFISNEELIKIAEDSVNPPLPHMIIGMIIPFHGIIYLVYTFINLRIINLKLHTSYSNIEKSEMQWMKIIIYGSAAVWIVVIFSYSLDLMDQQEFIGGILIYVTLSVYLFVLSFNSYRQPKGQLKGDEPEPPQVKTQKKSLPKEFVDDNLAKLTSLLEKEKLYTENNLSLRDLAERLEISTHNLSEVINNGLNKNFYDLINSYRIEEAKRLIANDKEMKYSIISLAYDAGFSSKTTFNSLFKKYCNMTPSEYRSNIDSNEQPA